MYLFVILCKRQVCNINRFRIIDVEKNLLSSSSDNPAHNIWRALDTLIPLPPCVNVGLVAADTQPNNSQSLNIDSGGTGALAHQDVFTYLLFLKIWGARQYIMGGIVWARAE